MSVTSGNSRPLAPAPDRRIRFLRRSPSFSPPKPNFSYLSPRLIPFLGNPEKNLSLMNYQSRCSQRRSQRFISGTPSHPYGHVRATQRRAPFSRLKIPTNGAVGMVGDTTELQADEHMPGWWWWWRWRGGGRVGHRFVFGRSRSCRVAPADRFGNRTQLGLSAGTSLVGRAKRKRLKKINIPTALERMSGRRDLDQVVFGDFFWLIPTKLKKGRAEI